MKKYSEVSKRYAKALFEILGGAKADATLIELRKASAAIANPKIKNLLSSPVLSRQEKVMVVTQVTASLGLSETTENIMKLMADKNRMDVFDEVVARFETISDEKNNVLRGEVQSASKLTDKEKAEVENAIAKFTGNQLLLEYSEDASLIGGLLAKVGSYTFDGTLNTQLTKLKEDVNRRN